MSRTEILSEINRIFIKVLNNKSVVLNELTSAIDIEEWDSLNHIQIIVSVEKHFNIRISSREIEKWKNIGHMIDSVVKQLNN